MSTLRYAWLALIAALAAGCGPSAVCTSDEDCADFGAGSTCVRGDRAEGLCSEGDASPIHDGGSEDDAGPPPADSGPTAVSVSVSVTPETVSASETVTLSWTSSPGAVSCEATAKSVHESSAAPVTGAPTAANGDAVVPVDQDTTFTVSCTDADGEVGIGTKAVDVATSGTLTSSPLELNRGATAALAWETFGASSCSIHDVNGEVYSIPASAMPTGSHVLPATSARYELQCDGSEVASVDLTLAYVRDLQTSPSALGPESEEVTLSWTYAGPDPASCTVSVNDEAAEPVADATDGHQVTLLAASQIVVSCDGYGEAVTASVTVPRLIESFVGPGSPLEYGTSTELSWTAATTASCELSDVPATSPTTVTPDATTPYTLVCTDGDKSASATVTVQVFPAQPVLSGEIVPVDDDDDGVVDRGELVLSALTSPNAVGCVVDVDGQDPGPLGTATVSGSDKVFSGTPPALSNAVQYTARCFSDDQGLVSTSSTGVVDVYYGDVMSSTGVITDVGEATLVMGNVNISGDAAVTSVAPLAGVRQVSGFVWFINLDNSSFTSLDALSIERVIGDVTVSDNAFLDNVGKDSPVAPENDTGLAWLEEVHGTLRIESNTSLEDIHMPRLTVLGRVLMIASNGELDTVSILNVVTIGGALAITGSPKLTDQAGSGDGFGSLLDINGAFTLTNTGLSSLAAYFPALDIVRGSPFTITSNQYLPCEPAENLYCSLATAPSSAIIADNNGSTGTTCSVTPSC